MVEDEGEVSGITTVCGTPSEMARVGRSTRAQAGMLVGGEETGLVTAR